MDIPLVEGGQGWGTPKPSTPTVQIQLQTSKVHLAFIFLSFYFIFFHLAFNTGSILPPAQRLHSTCDMPVCSMDFTYINWFHTRCGRNHVEIEAQRGEVTPPRTHSKRQSQDSNLCYLTIDVCLNHVISVVPNTFWASAALSARKKKNRRPGEPMTNLGMGLCTLIVDGLDLV